jgi:hypothetical protein
MWSKSLLYHVFSKTRLEEDDVGVEKRGANLIFEYIQETSFV